MATIQETQITETIINDFRDAFENDAAAKVSQNAVSQTSIDNIAMVRDVVQSTDFSFSSNSLNLSR